MEAQNWTGLLLVLALAAVMTLGGVWRTEEEPPVPADDPTRHPNWCHAHNQMWPACAGQHEEKK